MVRGLTVGAGAPLPTNVVRLAIALKIASFAKRYSGVRLEVVRRLQLFLKKEIYPVVPGKGSVGASGDLAPLAYISAVLIRVGDVEYKGKVTPVDSVYQELGLEPIRLEAKEGLAMVNGTQISTALALAALFETEQAFSTAIVTGALTTEAVLGLEEAFDSRIHTHYAGMQARSKWPSPYINSSLVAAFVSQHAGQERHKIPTPFVVNHRPLDLAVRFCPGPRRSSLKKPML